METLNRLLANELDNATHAIVRNMEQSGETATGKTARSFSYQVSNGTAQIEAPEWAFTLEKGRGPAQGSSGNPGLIDNLREWIVAKGIPYNDEDDLQRLARFLAWHINKFGTRLYRRGGRRDIYTPVIDQLQEELPAKIAAYYTTQLTQLL